MPHVDDLIYPAQLEATLINLWRRVYELEADIELCTEPETIRQIRRECNQLYNHIEETDDELNRVLEYERNPQP